MKLRPIANPLYRAHSNDVGPQEAATATGWSRFDDYRAEEGAERFHMLYVGESIEGCFAEKLQRYAASNAEAHAILDAVTSHVADDRTVVVRDCVPAPVLRNLALSTLDVLDPTAHVVEATDPDTLTAVAALAAEHGIMDLPAPPLKAGTILANDHAAAQRMSVIVEASVKDVAGIRYRSALDDPHDLERVHMNVALYRKLPTEGGDVRVSLRRARTGLAVLDYRAELEAALAFLQAGTELPLDHPELKPAP